MDGYQDLVDLMDEYEEMVTKQAVEMASATKSLIERVFPKVASRVDSTKPDQHVRPAAAVSNPLGDGHRQVIYARPDEQPQVLRSCSTQDEGKCLHDKARSMVQNHTVGMSGCGGVSLDVFGCYLSVWVGHDLLDDACHHNTPVQSGHSRLRESCEWSCNAMAEKASLEISGELIGPWAADGGEGMLDTNRLPPAMVHPRFRHGSWFDWEATAGCQSPHEQCGQELPLSGEDGFHSGSHLFANPQAWAGGNLENFASIWNRNPGNGGIGDESGKGVARFQILYPREGAVYFEGYVPVSYTLEGYLPRDFRVAVFLDGIALDVISSGKGGEIETPFRTPFRTFNIWLDAGSHILWLEVADGSVIEDANEVEPMAVATVTVDVVSAFCSICCPTLPSGPFLDNGAKTKIHEDRRVEQMNDGMDAADENGSHDQSSVLIVIVVFNQVEMLSYQVGCF